MSKEDYFLADDPDTILAAMAALRAESSGAVARPEGLNAHPERWAHVEVPPPLLHPGLRPLIAARLGCTEKELLEVAHRSANLNDDGSVVPTRRDDYGNRVFDDLDEEARLARGLEFIQERLGADGETLMPRWLPITAPELRAGSRDPQNDAYRRVLNRAHRLQRLIELNAPQIINDNEERLLQQAYERLYETARGELSARQSGATVADDAQTTALLHDVYANPGDDGPRAVYADRLSELGDPRGEFISLQLARPNAKRLSRAENELLRRYYDRWVGELGPVIDRDVFRRGFLYSCRALRVEQVGLLESEAWATVEQLDSDEPALITAPQLRALRELRMPFKTWLALERGGQPLPNIERAMVRTTRCPPTNAERVVGRELLPNLQELVILHHSAEGEHDWSWLLDTPLAQGLRSLTLGGALERLGEPTLRRWAAVLARHRALSELTLSYGKRSLVFELRADAHGDVTLTMRPARRFSELVAMYEAADYPGQLARTLEGVEAQLTVVSKHTWGGERLEALAQRLRDAGASWSTS